MSATQYFLIEKTGWQLGEVWKAPTEVFDITLDWSRLLAGDTIQSVTWVLPAGWTQPASASIDTTASKCKVWVGSGDAGTISSISCTIVTVGGRTYRAQVICHVRELPT